MLTIERSLGILKDLIKQFDLTIRLLIKNETLCPNTLTRNYFGLEKKFNPPFDVKVTL